MNGVAQFMEPIFDWTWTSSLYASVLILLVFLVQFAFGKWLPVRWRYLLGLLVLLRLILPAAPESKWSVFNLSKHFAPAGPPSAVPAAPQGENVPNSYRALRPLTRPPATLSPGGGEGRGEGVHGQETPAGISTLPESASFPREEAGEAIDWMTAAQIAWLLGLAGSLLVAVWQHGRFANWISGLPALRNERVDSLLNHCKELMNVRREVVVVSTPGLGTPALFGFYKPRLLLPEGTLEKLDDRELRMVFLHELAHVRRGDILLNWAMILIRALHWFNPLVWLAMKRLRADRELVCDAMVLSHLAADDRPVYGNTLIKLLDDFSGAGFCPSLVPVINNKSEIKRRVTMIAKFKTPGRGAVLASAAVVVALCGFTFTRAAVNQQKPLSGETPAKPGDGPTAANHGNRGIDILQERAAAMNDQIRAAEAKLDELCRELRISVDGTPPGFLTPETVRRLESERITVQADYAGKAGLLESLKRINAEKGVSELRKLIPTVAPDEILSRLLQELAITEATLVRLRVNYGEEHPEVKAVAAMQSDLSKKVDQRIEGILSGLELKVAAAKAQLDSLAKSVSDAKGQDAEMTAQYRPYFREKRELDNLQKVRDAVVLRILQETVDADLRPSQ
jgi:beta-lactamase regulating signal transducer with metallopeptidase domain